MGLTVQYCLHLPGTLPAEAVFDLARAARRRAVEFVRRRGLTRVTPLRPVEPASPWCCEFVKGRRPSGDIFHDVAPQRGWLFEVLLGRDCEPLTFALCRYPATIFVQGRRLRTHLSGWTYSGHCKTQYASLHGEAYFLRCHRAAIDLLCSWQRLGLELEINDEGEYWPGRNTTALLAEVRHMNCAIAALAGAAKDATDESGGTSVEAPIFRHAAFEHLETEGATRHTLNLTDALQAVAAAATAAKPKTRKPQREKSDDELI